MTTDPATEADEEHHRGRLWRLSDDGRRRLKLGLNPETIRVLTRALDQGILDDTYVHDGTPVVLERISGTLRVAAGDEDAPIPVRPFELRPARLAGLIAEQVDAYRVRKIKDREETYEEEVMPSKSVLEAVLARKDWPGLAPLHKVISTPVLRPDGTLLQTPGYDAATGYYLAGRIEYGEIPEDPTAAEVAEAREFLLKRFLRDFPWVSLADRANYLALLATPILRPMTRALSPFGVVDATMPGSGKTILTSCVGLMVGQRVLNWTDSEEELRKSITTVLGDPGGVVVWDNLVEGTVIDSAVLARLVTEHMWADRRLGTNSAFSAENDRLWLATGNNLRTGGDMASRSVWVRLDPDCPHPEERTGFSIPNLDTWILDPANQAVVLRHLLILILDWTRAGAPRAYEVPAMRQFTTWAQTLGGFLRHHEVTGFLDNLNDARELDDDHAEWRAFLLQWNRVYGDRHVGGAELRRSAEPEPGMPDRWDGTFPTTTSGKSLSVKSLGRRLTGQAGRWRGDIVLRCEIDPVTNCKAYWIEHAPKPEESPPLAATPETNPETRKPGEVPPDLGFLPPGFESGRTS